MWTFGIITDGTQSKRLNQSIESIIMECELQSDYEIIIIGGADKDIAFDDIKHIEFDETIKLSWITRKKNICVQQAIYPNVVLLHDYVSLMPGWINGYKKFGDDWISCINPIQNMDGTGFRDLCEIYNDSWMDPPIDDQKAPEYPLGKLITYNQKPNPRWQYVSGAYGIFKKEVLLNNPFDESRVHGQGEDVKISRELFKKYGSNFCSFNPYSKVRFLKQKEKAIWE